MRKFFPNRHWCHLTLLILLVFSTVATADVHTLENVIPKESFFYLKFQNLQTCRETVKTSAHWKETADIITASPKWSPFQQFLQLLPMFVGSDIQGIVETFLNDQIAFTVSPGPTGLHIAFVIHTQGKTGNATQLLTKLVNSMSGQGNQIIVTESDYRNITYHTVQINEQRIKYGAVDKNTLIVGITEGSFEKLIDVYRQTSPSIATHMEYQDVAKVFGRREVFAFVDMAVASPFLNALLPPTLSIELAPFRTIVWHADISQTNSQPGGFYLKRDIHGRPADREPEPETARLKIAQALSGEDEFFLMLDTTTAQKLVGLIAGHTVISSSTNTAPVPDSQIPEAEGLLATLIPIQTDAAETLAGKLVFTVNLRTFFEQIQSDDTQFGIKTNLDEGIIELRFPEMDIGLVLDPDSPEEAQSLITHILENLTLTSTRRFDYKGYTFTADAFPGTFYYGNVDGMLVFAFSEVRLKAIVDNLVRETVPPFQQEIDRLSPSFLAQLDLDAYFSTFATEEEAPLLSRQIGVLQLKNTQQDGATWMTIQFLPKKTGIEAAALLVPVLLFEIMDLPFAR